VISTTIRLHKKQNDKTTNNYRPFSNPFSCKKAKQEELLINETELPTQADTTESRLDQQSDDPNTQPNSYKTQKKSKDRKLRFTLFKCRHACLF
jgi:hypothetical protein